MARDDLDLFRGDNKGYKPHYWLKKLKGTMAHDAVDAARLWKFENGLASGAPAEVWFEALPAAEKMTWVELMKAFKKKWPVPVEMAATKEELIDRIKSTILRAEDLGKTVGPPGDEMTAHQRWVADMRPLVEDIGDPTMLLRRDVRETLPLEVRSLLPAQGLTTWDKFFAAVDGIEVVSIRDELERSARATGARDARAEEDAALWTLIPGFQAYLASTSGPQYQGYRATPAPRVTYPSVLTPQRAPTTPQQPMTQPAAYRQPLLSPSQPPVTPQRGAPPHMTQAQMLASPGNPFAPATYQHPTPTRFMQQLMLASPGSPSNGRVGARNSLGGDPAKDLAIAKRAAATPRTYPATAAGVQLYQTDMSAWDVTYGASTANAPDYAMFPLSPGTLPAGSKECWTCGLIPNPPHFGAAKCRASGSNTVPQREYNMRVFIGNTLFLPGERTPRFSSVAQIEADTYNPMGVYDVHQMLFEEQEEPEQGNGEGPA
ncbi:hypothetical protein B0H10DRAFT_2212182 [Mycena sp. CBHHK59/15]|nr:hypothetical protein B0H10DRAFT_2212182 [Mycena sp. CBHHK59/15]